MPIFGWIRDALGIHKDNVEIDKAELEIKKLEDEQTARHLITPPTMKQIRQYDRKRQRLEMEIRNLPNPQTMRPDSNMIPSPLVEKGQWGERIGVWVCRLIVLLFALALARRRLLRTAIVVGEPTMLLP
jgi:hypothetical protein